MTHAQLIYLILVVVAFLAFTGSLLMATISTVSLGAKDGEPGGHAGAAPRSDRHA